jgi:hypothetical protein
VRDGWDDEDPRYRERVSKVNRWLVRYGDGLSPLSRPAGDLLAARLEVRARVRRPVIVLGAISLAVYLWSATGTSRVGSARAVVAVLLIIPAPILWAAALKRGERWLAAGLPQRVGASVQPSIRAVFGTVRSLNLVVIIGLNVALLACLANTDASRGLVLLYAVAQLSAAAVMGITVRSVLRRPTIAVDADSLTYDLRLRSIDSYSATVPLIATLTAFAVIFNGLAVQQLGPIGEIFGPSFCVVGLVESLARRQRPHRAPPSGNWRGALG